MRSIFPPTAVALALASCGWLDPAEGTDLLNAGEEEAEDARTEVEPAPIVPLVEAPSESPRLAGDRADALAAQIERELNDDDARVLAVATDRPLYRPGETIWARVFDRRPDLGAEGAPDWIEIALIDGRGVAIATHRRPGDRASAHAAIDLPQGLAGGMYTLRATAGGRIAERPVVVEGFEAPKIRKELQLLREAYGPGEEVTAALSVATAGGGPLADREVEVLVQAGGAPIARQPARTDGAGEATIRFTLPDDLDRSDVLLTVLVEEGGWRESISRPVPVVLDEVGIEWFPEGGDLVAGLPSRVYLRSRNRHGEPADVAGIVVDDRGAEVARFRTVHDGLGRFALAAAPGRTYTAKLTEPSSVEGQTLPLPRARAEGCVLTSYDDLDGAIAALRVGVKCTSEREIVVAGSHRGKLIDSAAVLAGPSGAVVHLASGDAARDRAQGAALVTAYADGRPVAERMVYRNRHRRLSISIAPDRAELGPRDEVVLTVTTRDADGEPTAADVALSVVDDRLLKYADDENGHLLTDVYLAPWIGEADLHDPAWYFDPTEPEAGLGLDLVAGTYGWRRFVDPTEVAKREEGAKASEATIGEGTAGLGAESDRKGEKIRVDKRERDRQIAENAGILGAMDPDDLQQVFGAQGLANGLEGGIGGLIGAGGDQLGAGGLGARGVGLGGGGAAEGLGGLGTKGLGAKGVGIGSGIGGARGQRHGRGLRQGAAGASGRGAGGGSGRWGAIPSSSGRSIGG